MRSRKNRDDGCKRAASQGGPVIVLHKLLNRYQFTDLDFSNCGPWPSDMDTMWG